MRTLIALVATVAIATTACQPRPVQQTQSVLLVNLGTVEDSVKQAATEALVENYLVHVDFKQIDLPQECYYEPRDRYRADKILAFLEKTYKDYDRIVALTEADISVSKDDHEDWGVFGFGRQPGKAAVVSSFRLKGSKDQLHERVYKVVIHEYGHTAGLPHCTAVDTCPMQDAEGKVSTVDKSDAFLCHTCDEAAGDYTKPDGAA